MRTWLGQKVAPFSDTKTFTVKGAWQFTSVALDCREFAFPITPSRQWFADAKFHEGTSANLRQPLTSVVQHSVSAEVDPVAIRVIDVAVRPPDVQRIPIHPAFPTIGPNCLAFARVVVHWIEFAQDPADIHVFPVTLVIPTIGPNADLILASPIVFAPALFDSVTVSDNLLTPIFIPGVNGKDYVEKRKDEQQHLFDGIENDDDEAVASDKHELRKAYRDTTASGKPTRLMLSFWDLIFPILSRPLNVDAPDLLDLPDVLFPFQIDGIKRLLANKSFLLADEMGTGKTVMTCVALRMLVQIGKIQRALVVCPRSVLHVWDTHLRDWASNLSVTVVHGSRDVRQVDWHCPAHVYVVTYDALRNDTKKQEHETRTLLEKAIGSSRFDLVVLDEAHAIRNAKSKRARAVVRVSKDAAYRWALTGTPVHNSVMDYLGIFAFVKPSLFAKCDESIGNEEARRRIARYFLRRRKLDVFTELPPKIPSPVWLDMNDAQQVEYESVLSAGRTEFRSGKKELSRIHVFALLGKLKQICNFASGSAESPKTEALLEHVEEIVANGKKVVIFTQYKPEGVHKLVPLLERRRWEVAGKNVVVKVLSITGDTSDTDRRRAVDQFQNDRDTRILVGTPSTAGEGITLTAASYVIHFDHWWNPAVARQAEDRCHRKGQTETVNVYSYWMKGTIEERIRTILEKKSLLHAEIVDGLSEREFDSALSIDDLLDVLDLDRESVKLSASEARNQERTTTLTEIIAELGRVDPYDFEHITCSVFRQALGFPNARVTKKSADGGIDVEATRVVKGKAERIVAQCKRSKNVGREVAQQLLGVVTANPELSKGFLVTSGGFTKPCRDFCAAQPQLEMIDGIQLARRIQECGIDITQPQSRHRETPP